MGIDPLPPHTPEHSTTREELGRPQVQRGHSCDCKREAGEKLAGTKPCLHRQAWESLQGNGFLLFSPATVREMAPSNCREATCRELTSPSVLPGSGRAGPAPVTLMSPREPVPQEPFQLTYASRRLLGGTSPHSLQLCRVLSHLGAPLLLPQVHLLWAFLSASALKLQKGSGQAVTEWR